MTDSCVPPRRLSVQAEEKSKSKVSLLTVVVLCLLVCLPACLFACLHACLFACLLVCLESLHCDSGLTAVHHPGDMHAVPCGTSLPVKEEIDGSTCMEGKQQSRSLSGHSVLISDAEG